MPSAANIAFVVESTLGRLAKWLRLAGFDARYDALPPDVRRLAVQLTHQDALVLTRTRAVYRQLPAGRAIFIDFNAPSDQIRQVIRELGLQRDDLQPLSRCAACNQSLAHLTRAEVQGRVPDYVRTLHDRFTACPQCGRIYWPGTHAVHCHAEMLRWFDT